MDKDILYLSKAITTDKVVFRLLLKQTKKRKQAIAIVTNLDYTKQIKDSIKPLDYDLFINSKDSLKVYTVKVLTEYQQFIKESYIDDLIEDLEVKIEDSITAPETLELIGNENFNKCYNFSLELLTPKDKESKIKLSRALSILDQVELFIIENYKEELYNIIESINKNDDYKSLIIDYEVLDLKAPNLADILEDNPDTLINSFNKAIANLREDNNKTIILTRFKNINNKLKFREVKKSKRIGQLLELEATVKLTEDIRPEIDTALFICNECQRLHEVKQRDSNSLAYPSVCNECGGRSFTLDESESKFKDVQNLLIQEPLEESKGQPKTLRLKLNTDLVDKAIAGTTAKITGILRTTKPKSKKDNKQDFILDANNIKSLDKDLDDIVITPEEEATILEISKREDLIQYLANGIAPNVRGYSEIKKGLLCSIAGAGETNKKRSNIHILIIGDPGIAKTQLIRGLEDITVKSITTDGHGASSKGLTAVVTKDSNDNWTIEAGALALANNGYVFIDEIDKLAKEKQSELNTPLESSVIYVDRGGIRATLQANTTVLAFGNPKFRRFSNLRATTVEQLNINDDLKSRFDLIYAIQDIPDIKKDSIVGNAITNSYVKEMDKEDNYTLDTDILKKYIIYAKRNYKPYLAKDCIEYLNNHYVESRNKDYDPEDEILSYEARDLDSLIRIAGALSKLKFNEEITIDEVKEAIAIQNYYLKSIGIDPITNKVDIARAKGIPETAEKRARATLRRIIKDTINESVNNGLGIDYIEKAELKELFINETGYSYETFKKRFRELTNSNDIKVIGKRIYLIDDTNDS